MVCMQISIAQDRIPTTSQKSEKSTNIASCTTTKETIKKNPNDKILDLFNSSIIKQTSYKRSEDTRLNSSHWNKSRMPSSA